jgi:hypothetical protein
MLATAALVGLIATVGAPADRPWKTWQPAPIVLPTPNAWDLYLKVFGLMHKIDVAQGLASDEPPDFSQPKPPAKSTPPPLPDKWGIGPPGLPLTQRVALYADVLALVRQALGEECRIPPPQSIEDFSTTFPDLARMRDLAPLLAMESAAHRQQGHFLAAADSALDCMQMAQQAATQRMIVADLSAYAIEDMGGGALDDVVPQLSAAELRHVLSRLAAIDVRRVPLRDSVDGEERLTFITLKSFGEDPHQLLTADQPGSEEGGQDFIRAADAEKVLARIAGAWHFARAYYDQLDRSIRLPYRDRKPLPKPPADMEDYLVLPPQVFLFAYARDCARANLRLTRLAARCYLLEKGKLPGSLSDLSPDYLRRVPIDPFSGGPLRSRPAGDVLVMYSVGPDGVDDGGQPIEWPLRAGSKGDIVVRVSAGGAEPTIGDKRLGVRLDERRNYALAGVWVDGVEFPSGGAFPCLELFDSSGAVHQVEADDSRASRPERSGTTLRVRYTWPGFEADVTWRIEHGMITVSVAPVLEKDFKARGLGDGGALLTIPITAPDAENTGYILRPLYAGEIDRFPPGRETVSLTYPQCWDYKCTFEALGYAGRAVIVRCPQFGCQWIAGAGDVNGTYSLRMGLIADFRPRRDNPGPYSFWNLALVEPHLDLQIVPVGDVNGDGVCNWVDIGVAYRRKFLRRNPDPDRKLPGAMIGKIDMAGPYTGCPNYSQLIEQIRSVDFAPQTWWLVGAHTPPGYDFAVPPYADAPDPSHNGPGGYDYFALKRDAAKVGARIGLHEIFHETTPLNSDWGKVPTRIQEYGEHMGVWKGKTPSGPEMWTISKALDAMLADGSLFRELDKHFRDWQVHRGDTWHWDTFTSFGGRADFSPAHPVTHGRDFRDRIEVLKGIKSRGVRITSEGLQEGVSEFTDCVWYAKTEPGRKPDFPGGESVPLVAALFQGMTYYGVGWHTAWDLLHGGTGFHETTGLRKIDAESVVFGTSLPWSLIADRTVLNMTRAGDVWTVTYDDGGKLTVDLAGMTPAMSWKLEAGGRTYDADHLPPTAFGVTARREGDGYVLTYPAKGHR